MAPDLLFCGRAAALAMLLLGAPWMAAADPIGFANPIHEYWTRPPEDRFTRLKNALERGETVLETQSDDALLRSLLKALEVPVSSQLLVFSATSLQTPIISPRNPRALYFNDDTFVGYVPGGRIEVISLDPQLGGIFYLFDRLGGNRLPRIERSNRCMNCHAPAVTHRIPGLLVESTVPGMSGGGEEAFRGELSGHGIPLRERFGGWHVTGAAPEFKHWGNLVMESHAGMRREIPVAPGQLFNLERYPVSTSDLLAHLIHEHQLGFINRALEAGYRTREDAGADAQALDAQAALLVRYLLFADEAPLPPGGVAGVPEFRDAFLSAKKPASTGRSLRDLDLETRLFRLRCSYMIYSAAFSGLPPVLKSRVYALLGEALQEPGAQFAYLPVEERREIAGILRETLPDLPAGF